jgi:hypothetical protein
MDLTLLWIALAALVGAILHQLLQSGTSWKQTIITGVITAVIFAAGYQLQGATLTILDLFLAVIGGYGVNATVSGIQLKKQNAALTKKLASFSIQPK